jgi:hypothetical protein
MRAGRIGAFQTCTSRPRPWEDNHLMWEIRLPVARKHSIGPASARVSAITTRPRGPATSGDPWPDGIWARTIRTATER